jgi:peptide/nickel transport system substrate-binding protein
LLASLDSDLAANGIAVSALGISETLMRVTPDMQIVPWVAERLDPVDTLTWRVTLRPDVTFHDGSPVDAEAVKASLERSMAAQPGTTSIIPAGTSFTASGLVLEIRTPTPVGAMASSLAAGNFAVRKNNPDGTVAYTGPYMPTEFVERQSVTLVAYQGYRGGPARTPRILVRSIQDVNTRVLALQAGDVDIAHALLPSDVAKLTAAGFQVHAFPFGRQNVLILNVTRAPLDDFLVRQAVALAVDREALVAGVMDGYATPAYALAPDTLGLRGLVNTQLSDPDAARALLDAAGWTAGADGIRVKDGTRLTFTLGSYVQRAELEPLATAMRDQLLDVGIETRLEVYPDINKTVAESTFDATMYSYVTAPFGDVNRALLQLYTPSGTNRDRYSNPAVNKLFRQYNETADPSTRLDLLGQIQTLIGQDTPVVYVVNPYQITATSARVRGFQAHPLENYKIDGALAAE